MQNNTVSSNGNLPLACLGALAGALLGAIIWAGVSAAANAQIGFMAIGVGFLAAYGARLFGRGHG
ncbi:MAG: hypothetical protein M3N19_05535, partial [Candidatus Eremiobacteraeota bacterium]|nr:hypothetical protein [Candidatus Eremiobacteraeota bacterium]